MAFSPTLFKILPIFESNEYLLDQIFAVEYIGLDLVCTSSQQKLSSQKIVYVFEL